MKKSLFLLLALFTILSCSKKEVLDNKINIYNASSEDGNYDIGWLSNAIYTLEASFKLKKR